MARYADDARERVRDAVDFVAVVEEKTELKRSGQRRLTGLCPFHEERSPSFGIDPVEKLYHCFGCGAGGDVFKFVMETEGLGFGEALEALAERSGVELEPVQDDPEAAARRARRERLLALLERTAAYYVRVLWEADEALDARRYLLGRGLTEAALREYRVGYSPSAWDRVLLASRRAGYSAQEVWAAGLLRRSSGNGRVFDAFRGRIMFPLADRRGRVLGFGARAMRDAQGPKYVNTSETEVFTKGRQVYGYDLARAAASREGSVVLAEGYTDVIALRQAGIEHAVGLMGTALTREQARELHGLARTVSLCLDADDAGQNAMIKAAELIGAAGGEAQVVPLPPGADPADILARGEEGAAELKALLDRAMPFARFRIERALGSARLSSGELRRRKLDNVAPVLGTLPAGTLRSELIQFTADRLDLSPSLVESLLAPATGAGPANGAPARAPLAGAEYRLDSVDRTERAFLARCVAMPEAGARRLRAMDLDAAFTSELSRRGAALVRDHAAAPSSALGDDDPELASLVAELVLRADELEPSAASLEVEALQLDLARVDREITAARVAGADVLTLSRERQRIRDDIRHKLH